MKGTSLIIAALASLVIAAAPATGQGVLNSLEKEIGSLVDGIRPSLVTVEASDKENGRRSWVGSGVAWSGDGKVVTTASLISEEDAITVTLAGGEKYPARVLGIDDQYNLALLKVDAPGLRAVTLGNSDLVKPGSWVTVIGNSYGLASSVNFGLVNGVREKDSLLQLSASVAPGTAGGPVLNTAGEMIGMVHGRMAESLDLGPLRILGEQKQRQVAFLSQPLELPASETALAIPANKIAAVCADLEQHGTRKKGFLGVTFSDLGEDELRKLKLPSGLKVEDVVDGSPAEKSGVKDDDVIVEFGGRKVTGTAEFRKMVAETKPGTKVKLRVKRDGKDRTLAVELGEAPGRSIKVRMKKLVLPDLDIDLPDLKVPEIEIKRFQRLDAEGLDEIKDELKQLKDELQRLKEELRAKQGKVRIEQRKQEQQGGGM